MNRSEARTRVEAARVGRLATVDAHGHPRVVPVVFAIADDAIYSPVDHKPKRTVDLKRLDNIRNRPEVSLLVDHYDDDWGRLWWVRVDGTARILEEGGEWERAAAALRQKYSQYRERPLRHAIIAIDADAWRGWTADVEG